MIRPSSRAAALEQLAAFLPKAPLYARDRNHVQPGHSAAWDAHRFPASKRQWLLEALNDTVRRATGHWQTAAANAISDDLADDLVRWAKDHRLQEIVALRPETGPLEDALPEIAAALSGSGISLSFVDRPRDLILRPLATGGFFQFWERMQKCGLLPAGIASAGSML